MPGEIFYWIFNMSIAATVCAVLILPLRFVKKIPRRFFIWLWLIPFIRMCIPVGISSKYGIMALISKFTTKTVVIHEIGEFAELTMMNYSMGASDYFPLVYKVNLLEDVFNVASVIWLAVALASILTLTVLYFTTLGEMKDARHIRDDIYQSDKIKTPAVYGIIRPKIVLPIEYRESELKYILMHERAHIRRSDNIIRLIAFAVVCLHWFNPFAWLVLKLLCLDIELACDEAVLSKCNESERTEYARALLLAAEKTNVFAASFGGSKIRLRIENILSYKKMTVISLIGFTALITAIFYVLITNAP